MKWGDFMINIDNTPLQFDEFIKEYPEKSTEREVASIMWNSNEQYNYKNLDLLKFELNMRKEIVNSANRLHDSGLRFKVFRESKCNEKYWERTKDGGFKLKKDVNASEAIEDIFKNGSKYGTECATALLIVYFGALLNVYGRDNFDRLFTEITLMNWHKIHPLLREVGWVNKVKDHLPGDRRYFDNPDVDPLHPEWQGENVIDMGNGIYYGHGAGKRSAKSFINKLNKLRKKNAEKSAYLMEEAGRPNFSNLYSKIQVTNIAYEVTGNI